jgi:hypothetical protein
MVFPTPIYLTPTPTSNARKYGVFIDCKSSSSPIYGLLEILVQVGEVKLLSFSSSALLLASAP